MARIMSLNYSRHGKPRRLWRLAVATQPTIAENWYKVTCYRCVSIPSGNYMGGGSHVPTASCAASQLAVGFHYIGPAPRNSQLKLNLLVVRGCVAMASRRSHAPINLRLIL